MQCHLRDHSGTCWLYVIQAHSVDAERRTHTILAARAGCGFGCGFGTVEKCRSEQSLL
jgi:hypothetical protein